MSDRHVPDFEVRIDGSVLAVVLRQRITQISFESDTERAATVSLTVPDPDMELFDRGVFAPGRTVELAMGYGNSLERMFEGKIAAIQPTFPSGGVPSLSITAYDYSYALRKTEVTEGLPLVDDISFVKMTAIKHGLIPELTYLPTELKSITANGTEWSVLRSMAEKNNLEVAVEFHNLYFGTQRSKAAGIILDYGRNLMSFSPRFNPNEKAAKVQVRAVNSVGGQSVVAQAAASALNSASDTVVNRLNGQFSSNSAIKVLSSTLVGNVAEANRLAESINRTANDETLSGSGTCAGEPELRAGQFVQIRGLGKSLSGVYRLSKVTHSISQSGYQTSFQISSSASGEIGGAIERSIQKTRQARRPDPIYGIKAATVTSTDDPLKLGRVKLNLSDIAEKNETDWVQVATLSAGSQMGTWFVPEVGEQVILAFLGGNADRPIVLGSTWTQQQRPPQTSTKQRAIHVKGDLIIQAGGKITLKADGGVDVKVGGGQKMNVGEE